MTELKGHNWMLDERQVLLPRDPVPRVSVILFSIVSHVIVLAFVIVAWRNAARIQVLPEQYMAVQSISGPAYLPLNSAQSKAAQPQASLPRVHRNTRAAHAPKPAIATGGPSAQALREHARQATAGLVRDLKFRQFYGFSTHDYQLAFRTAGEVPLISATDLPPRFEQYVMVEITIDIDGRVAEAQVVAGMVPPTIERRLLSAIREFKYSPAKRDGAPIPSQLEIVIHIPS